MKRREAGLAEETGCAQEEKSKQSAQLLGWGDHQDSTVDCTGAQTAMTRSCVGTAEEWPPQKCEAISMIHSTEKAFSFSYYSRKVK